MPSYIFGASLSNVDGGEFGNAVLSRFTIASSSVLAPYRPAGERHEISASDPETWWNVDEPRSMLVTTIDLGTTSVDVVVSHLGLTSEQRERQAADIMAGISANSNRTILLADLNGEPESPEVRCMAGKLVDAFSGWSAESRATRPSGTPTVIAGGGWFACRDYVFAGGQISVEDARVIHDESEASDHQPLVVTLSI
jgi:endonuclease/exonuclease/phosphatase family metal-dependent hydrolase